jgi:CheY-like chemotaxis protein
MDPSQAVQILANLCTNARDAIADVGKIKIETSNFVADESYCSAHAGVAPGDYVLLTVEDSGHGMDDQTLARIFEPFFTTKGVGQGTGLGLATVYGIIQQNKGFIEVESSPGRGTAFKIGLLRHMSEQPLPRTSLSGNHEARGKETVLLVEDEPMLLNLTATMLERLGYEVLTASNSAQALALAKEHSQRIRLLLTDVVMPEMNGRDLALQFQSICPAAKCLFMSGYTANVIASKNIAEEGFHFIQKPFSLKNLAVQLREVLEG